MLSPHGKYLAPLIFEDEGNLPPQDKIYNYPITTVGKTCGNCKEISLIELPQVNDALGTVSNTPFNFLIRFLTHVRTITFDNQFRTN